MLNALQIEFLTQFKQNNFSAQEWHEAALRKSHPNLRRGAIYHYDFDPLEIVEKGETCKDGRPIIIMDNDPIDRLLKKLSLHVVPVSHKAHNNISMLAVKVRNKDRGAIIAQATTVNSERIRNFVEILPLHNLGKIGNALTNHFDFFHNFQVHAFHQPGDIYDIPWPDEKHMRSFVIVSAAHLKQPYLPVLMMPFANQKAIKAEEPLDKPRPVARRRLEKGHHVGRISLTGLQRAQKVVLDSFGLAG